MTHGQITLMIWLGFFLILFVILAVIGTRQSDRPKPEPMVTPDEVRLRHGLDKPE